MPPAAPSFLLIVQRSKLGLEWVSAVSMLGQILSWRPVGKESNNGAAASLLVHSSCKLNTPNREGITHTHLRETALRPPPSTLIFKAPCSPFQCSTFSQHDLRQNMMPLKRRGQPWATPSRLSLSLPLSMTGALSQWQGRVGPVVEREHAVTLATDCQFVVAGWIDLQPEKVGLTKRTTPTALLAATVTTTTHALKSSN